MSNNTQPEIRFPGFTEDWEERKLGDVTKISTGKLDANAMVENGKYDFYTSGIKKYRIDVAAFEGPAITIAGNGATVGYMHLADNKFNAYQRTYVLQEFLVDRSFIFSEIGNKLPKKIKQEARTGNIPYIVMDMLTELKLSIPQNNSEQQKIGSFFKQLDDTIALHQRKLDLLKETKKGFLQKMFPKNGAKVPEIRFPGFTEDWEQRKAKELFIPKAEKNQPELPVLSVTQDHGVVYREQVGIDIKYDKATLKNYKVIHQGDFVISLRSFQGGFELSDKLGITSPAYTIFVPKNMDRQDNLFWKTKFKTFTFIESLKTVTFGIRDGKSISFSEFGDLKLFFPKNIEEQQKIGNFFKQLDDTITLHQRKLDLLKEMKKGFLQKMFV
ncbi:restriction endonuclease subunit S [Enterococcus faecium]|uniref:restriction endonuclease subunit S n=1 Tax=Enterococcus faecium TaxID=1352 RepID=UPI002413FA5D|nr:restriction endonuclease subunit S [Enterococcus faecium]MDG4587147.1 restriction endonuclease subunit S [Enterococcus faecium]